MNVPHWLDRNVSRETLDKLKGFDDLVKKWSPKINLVSKGDLAHLAHRHIWDSAQICEGIDLNTDWLDFGSGGGFPGIVVAILGEASGIHTVLVESDQRKCAFLRTASQKLDLNTSVVPERIETYGKTHNVISARAVASVDQLLALSVQCARPETVFVFPKGATWKEEIEIAKRYWHFDVQTRNSYTSDGAAILELRHVTRK